MYEKLIEINRSFCSQFEGKKVKVLVLVGNNTSKAKEKI